MRPTFVRMNPKVENMVKQTRTDYSGLIDILCVECGWEGSCHPGDNEVLHFLGHKCRLTSQSESTSD